MDPQAQAGQEQQMLQILQQKIGNLELTAQALIGALIDEDLINEDQVNEKAQELVQEMQEQQEQAAAAAEQPDDLQG